MAAVLFVLPVLGAFTVGDAIGLLAGIASILLKPHPKDPVFHAMASAWGKTWPQVWNSGRVAAQVIQTAPFVKHSKKKFGKHGPAYSQTVALGFCAGPRTMGRLWADQQVIYDPRPVIDATPWTPDTVYGAGDQVIPTAGSTTRIFIATVDGQSGAVEPVWNNTINGITNDNEEVWNTAKAPKPRKVGPQYNFTMRIYSGGETQMPDAALQAIVGAANQSAYRGLMYVVLENFDLSKYGNRIPNLEAEVFNLLAPVPFSPDAKVSPMFTTFGDIWGDPDGVSAYSYSNNIGVFPAETASLQKFDLTAPNVLLTGPPFNIYDNGLEGGAAPVGSWTGGKLWAFGSNGVPGPLNGAVIGFDKTTLAISDVLVTGVSPGRYAVPPGVNGDGTLVAGLGYWGGSHVVGIMNTATGQFTETDLAAVGGPANSTVETLYYVPLFDDRNQLWFYGEHGKLWRFTVTTPGGVPTISGGVSFVVRPDDGASFGQCDFNPDTKILTAWSIRATFPDATDTWAISFDTVGLVVTNIFALQANNSTEGSSTEMQGWNNKRYVSLAATAPTLPDGSTAPTHANGYIGRYDRLTGDWLYYDYPPTWNETIPSTPSGSPVNLGGTAIAFSGASMVGSMWPFAFPLPLFDYWFFPLSGNNLTLGDIIRDISGQIGLQPTDYNYSELDEVVPRGVVLLDRQTARQFCESLFPAYFFDMTDDGNQIVGTLRSNSSILLTITEDDLGTSDTPDKIVDRLSTQRANDIELVRDLSVSYYDVQHDYLQGSTAATRDPLSMYSSGRNTLTIPCVLTPQEAANISVRLLYLAWMERNIQKLSVSLDRVKITPADTIVAVRNGKNNLIRVTRATLQPSLVIDIEGVSEDLGTYSLTAPAQISDQTTGSFNPGTVNPIVGPVLAVLDTAPLQSSDLQIPGVYVAGAASIVDGGWDGETVEESVDDSVFDNVAQLTAESIMGAVDTVLADWPRYTILDTTNTVDVDVLFGQLASVPLASLTASATTNAIWFSNGEIIQFGTATFISGTKWRLSDLRRGRFGTEAFISTHAGGESWVLLDATTMATVAYEPSELDATRYWRGQNDAAAGSITPTQTLVMTTRRLMPFAPSFIRGTRDVGHNLTVTARPRMRWKGTPLWRPPETDGPARVEMDIMNGLAVVRTITSVASAGGSVVTDPAALSVYYSAADQVTDWGAVQPAVAVQIFKRNAIRGRGYPGKKTV